MEKGLLFAPQMAPAFVPTGVILDFGGSRAPSGFLMCDGSSYSVSSYPELFNTIGYIHGGSGGLFNVPDCRGRVTAGVGSVGTNNQPTLTLAGTGGEQNHTLLNTEMPHHNHSGATDVETSLHTHNLTQNLGAAVTNFVPGVGGVGIGGESNTSLVITAGENTTHIHGVAFDGSGSSHNNMPPYIAFNKIIKI